MKQLAFLLSTIICASGVTGVLVPANSSLVQYRGRFEHTSHGARFDMPGCEIRMHVEGASMVKMLLAQSMGPLSNSADADEPQRNEFTVFIDGKRVHGAPGSWCDIGPDGCTFDTAQAGNGTFDVYVVAKNLSNTHHDIRVIKATEPAWDSSPNWLTFSGFEIDAGSAVPALSSAPKRRIEFIGDSTITGYCNTCEGPMEPGGIMLSKLFVDWTADHYWTTAKHGSSGQSYISAWPHLLCESLGAECHTSAWSGMGLIHDCCADEDDFLPATKLWHRGVGGDQSSRWEFSQWAPEVLVINLGMNDGKRVNTPKWENAYVQLISNATSEYGKGLHLFLACGPVTGRYCAAVKRVVERTKAMGMNTHFLDQRRYLNGTYGGACCGHPSREVGKHMAKAAAAEIAARLNWGSEHYEEYGFIHSDLGVDGPFSEYECSEAHGQQCDHGLVELISPDNLAIMREHFQIPIDHGSLGFLSS